VLKFQRFDETKVSSINKISSSLISKMNDDHSPLSRKKTKQNKNHLLEVIKDGKGENQFAPLIKHPGLNSS